MLQNCHSDSFAAFFCFMPVCNSIIFIILPVFSLCLISVFLGYVFSVCIFVGLAFFLYDVMLIWHFVNICVRLFKKKRYCIT